MRAWISKGKEDGMRQARVKAEGVGYHHVVSRIVDRAFKMDDVEKEIFRDIMRRAEAFCGVRVLTYTVMSNHFHLLVEVGERTEVDEAELVRRMTLLYGRKHVAGVQRQWAEWRRMGLEHLVEEQQERLRARMYDLSAFVKTLKQRYSMSYNGRHGRKGTLWEDRFKSVLIEGAVGALAAVAAYIDLNPVRAGIVADPKDYRWGGYGEACAGGRLAREGLAAVHGAGAGEWRQVQKSCRELLYVAGEERRAVEEGGQVVRPGFSAAEVAHVLDEGGRLTLPQVLRCRVRYFTDGMALGGRAFVDGVFERNRRLFGSKRRDGARRMRFAEWGELRTARALRIAPVQLPCA